MKNRRRLFLATVMGLVLSLALAVPVPAAETPRLEKEKLKEMLGTPGLVLIDVRAGADWKASTQKIQGAVREDPEQVETWMNKYPQDKNKTLVFYCA